LLKKRCYYTHAPPNPFDPAGERCNLLFRREPRSTTQP